MILVTELNVVNACLASMGQAPINSLDSRNPFVTSATNALQDALVSEQSSGWYYNTERITVTRNAGDGYFYVPADVIGLIARRPFNPPWLALRGRRLYDNREGAYYTNDRQANLDIVIIRYIQLEELPFHAAAAIRARTVMKFQSDYDGDQLKIAQAQTEYALHRGELMAEHTRNVQANMLYQGSVGETIHENRYHIGVKSRWR